MEQLFSIPQAVEVVPRLWLGSNASCDQALHDYGFLCINVGKISHTQDPRCHFVPLCSGPGGVVDSTALTQMQALLFNAFVQNDKALLHCADALTQSPLAMALWLMQRYAISLPKAYQWVWDKQPRAKDLSALAPARAG